MFINTRPFLYTPAEDTRRYQFEMLDVIKDIDMVSQKYLIDYTIEAGTALGAARHEGFIPWDNDTDILMPNNQIKDFLIGMAREKLFDKYDIWYYDRGWGWMIKDVFIRGILEDPDNYCEVSLNWVIDRISFAIFRVVKREAIDISMSLTKGKNRYPVAHFDPSLSTASLVYKNMLPKEKRTWRQRYLKSSNKYSVHGFVDVFPTIEKTPKEFVKMKRGFYVRFLIHGIKLLFVSPRRLAAYFPRLKEMSFLPKTHVQKARGFDNANKFEDYRKVEAVDYKLGVKKARQAKNGDTMILSRAPWNLKKVIPYYRSELYPPKKVKFEDTMLSAPSQLHEVLTNHYKDYQKMPPVDERIQHSYHLDPNQFEQIVKINV